MSRRNLRDSRALVTGASSGIGRAIAVELARRGARLVAVARREDRLAQLVAEIHALGQPIHTVTADVTDPQARRRAIDCAVAAYGGLDILVNNAGIGAFGLFENSDADRLRRVMEVNFFALVELTRDAFPLLKRGTAMVVNISSVLGNRAVPRSAEYCASKFAVEGFQRDAPRGVDANWNRRARGFSGADANRLYRQFAVRIGHKPKWPKHAGVSAQHVARRTVRAMCAGKRTIMPFFWARVFCAASRIAPSLVDRILARYV